MSILKSPLFILLAVLASVNLVLYYLFLLPAGNCTNSSPSPILSATSIAQTPEITCETWGVDHNRCMTKVANNKKCVTEVDGKQYKMFFVRGIEKSGTTWMRTLLGNHPEINMSEKEVHFEYIYEAAMFRFIKQMDIISQALYTPLVNGWFLDFVREVMASLASTKPDAIYIAEKTPGPVKFLIPNCPHILIVRDGRDVLISFLYHYVNFPGELIGFCPKEIVDHKHIANYNKDKQYFEKNPSLLVESSDCVYRLGKYWAETLEQQLATVENAKTFGDDTSVFYLKYETLWHDVANVSKAMYRYLNVDEKKAPELTKWTTPGFNGFDLGAFYRKGKVNDWQTYFTPETVRIFKDAAGQQLIRAGYEKDINWINPIWK